MRGRGNAGVVKAARRFLATMELRPFSNRNEARFAEALDMATAALLKKLPPNARHWGLARKALNIFLRDCLYSRQMCEQFKLQAAERCFEIPLDGIVGKKLREKDGNVPGWKTIKALTPTLSDEYQSAASRIAQTEGVVRVDLDALWWGNLGRDG